MSEDRTQECVDAFYWRSGPCCAGCDHWQWHNSLVGDCTATPPAMSGADRQAFLGLHSSSAPTSPGHTPTFRDHNCGVFTDTFDWSALPLAYLKRIGANLTPPKDH